MNGNVEYAHDYDLIKVCIPNTKRDYYTYILPNGYNMLIGGRVLVPFRNKQRIGIILGVDGEQCVLKHAQLKAVETIIDSSPILVPSMLKLCHWVSGYYHSHLSEILPFVIPRFYRNDEALPIPTLHHLTNQPHHNPLPNHYMQPTLNLEQSKAVDVIKQHLHHYQCFLLYGITGSGKTEVYLQIIAAVLDANQQVLIIVPEIGLTPQLAMRLHERFNTEVTVIHSHLTPKRRRLAWENAHYGIAKLILGTRSAVFSQMPNLGLIIIDEEHDPSFKQQDRIRYLARDTALMRAYQANIPIILGSATPSFESLYNTINGKYLN